MKKRSHRSRVTSGETRAPKPSPPTSLSLDDFPPQQPIGPALEINDESLRCGTAGWAVLSIMVEPHDTEARKRGLAVTMAMLNEAVVSQYHEQDRQAVRNFLWQHDVEPLGGVRILLQAPGLTTLAAAMERGADKGLMAGAILNFVLAMNRAGHSASFNKATRLLERLAEKDPQRWPRGRPKTKISMLDIWQKYKAVAHLWAAFGLLRHVFEQKFPGSSLLAVLSPDPLRALLSVAQIFRGFGTHFYPHRQTQPLLDPAETWRCPYEGTLPDISIPVPSLGEWETKILDDYLSRGY